MRCRAADFLSRESAFPAVDVWVARAHDSGNMLLQGRWLHKAAGQGCSRVRPVEGRSCSAALKSEDRRPKPESRPKSEFREWSAWGATRRRAAPGQRGGQSGADHYRGTAAAGLAGGGLARPAQYGPFTAIPAGPAERSQERAKILARGVFLDIGLPTGRRKVRPIHCRTRRQQILTNSTIFLSFV